MNLASGDISKFEYAKNISKKLNNQIYIKREDLQPVFSFKLRGAYNKIQKLINLFRNTINIITLLFSHVPHVNDMSLH